MQVAFKGSSVGQVLVADPWSLGEVGSVYLVFLDETGHSVSTLLRNDEVCHGFDPTAPYYTIHEGLSRHMRLVVTPYGEPLSVAVSCPEGDVPIPRSLKRRRRKQWWGNDELLVSRDQLYESIQMLVRAGV